jgi:hypothetical protein
MATIKDTSDDRNWRREVTLANGDVWVFEREFNATTALAFQQTALHALPTSKFFAIVVDPSSDACLADLDAFIGGLQALRAEIVETEAQFWTKDNPNASS